MNEVLFGKNQLFPEMRIVKNAQGDLHPPAKNGGYSIVVEKIMHDSRNGLSVLVGNYRVIIRRKNGEENTLVLDAENEQEAMQKALNTNIH